ncbi:MAG TPA: Gfo/Idh/MocA family oxidoreductase [Candidatus Limnocylindrales bacterium]|nr:Gfo/Idh/MocA family oxidoreductase [Candidatus Limnocylindrales bacterium]
MTDRTLRWGVLSTADIARRKWIPGVRRSPRRRGEVVAIASRDGAAAERVAKELAIPRGHGSYEGLLADPEVDAVYIPLPNHLHLEWALAAAKAAKHVLVEKPIALSSKDAETMVAAASDAGVLLMEAFMYRLHPSWVAVRELIAAGRIGRLQTVQSWFSYYNDDPRNIRNIAAAGGGALMDIGCYSINLSRMLFGAEPQRVEAATLRDPDHEVDVLTSALLVFPGGGTATFTCSTRSETDQRVHIYGTEGHLSVGIPFNIPPDRPTEVFLTHGGEPPVAPAVERFTFETADPYGVEADAFADAVLDGAPLPTPPEDAVANMRVIEQVFEAAARR